VHPFLGKEIFKDLPKTSGERGPCTCTVHE